MSGVPSEGVDPTAGRYWSVMMRISFQVSLPDQELLPYLLPSVDLLCFARVYSRERGSLPGGL